MKTDLIAFFLLFLLIISCSPNKKICNSLGSDSYKFIPDASWVNVSKSINCAGNEKKVDLTIIHDCVDLSQYKIAISLGKQYLYYGDYKENLTLIFCQKQNLNTMIIRVIDDNKVYQWNRKESYEIDSGDKIKIKLPYDNKNKEYSIRFS